MKRLLTLIALLLFLITSCGSESDQEAGNTTAAATVIPVAAPVEDPQPEPTSEPTGALGAQSPEMEKLIDNLVAGYPAMPKVWPGFEPTEHPVVLAEADQNDETIGAITINYPKPDSLGTATLIADHPETGPIHRITNLSDEARSGLVLRGGFEFNRIVNGVDSFVMVAGGSDPVFKIDTEQYIATLLHEMFHRYQFVAFADGFAGQDVAGYDYSAGNIELALLEEAALRQAVLAAPGSDAQRQAASWLAGLRIHRLERDGRVALDGAQERFEGTARWLEHALDISTARNSAQGVASGLLSSEQIGGIGIKDYFGFGRWYGSGAAALEVAGGLGIADRHTKIEAGSDPISLIATELGVSRDTSDGLVAAAREALDPNGDLMDLAADFALQAANEGSPFDEDEATEVEDLDGGSEGGVSEGDAMQDDGMEGAVMITDEQLTCLSEAGVDLSNPSFEISLEVEERCFGPSS